MSDGSKTVQTAKLDLVAKDESTRNTVKHITIWVDPVQDVSLKQQIFMPDGNIQTATYTNLRVNQLNKSAIEAFAIKTNEQDYGRSALMVQRGAKTAPAQTRRMGKNSRV